VEVVEVGKINSGKSMKIPRILRKLIIDEQKSQTLRIFIYQQDKTQYVPKTYSHTITGFGSVISLNFPNDFFIKLIVANKQTDYMITRKIILPYSSF
jgi:hypothetical protein